VGVGVAVAMVIGANCRRDHSGKICTAAEILTHACVASDVTHASARREYPARAGVLERADLRYGNRHPKSTLEQL
jgi:hypothetical protein